MKPKPHLATTWPGGSKVFSDAKAVAAADLELRFEKQQSRTRAVLETLDLKLEERKQARSDGMYTSSSGR